MERRNDMWTTPETRLKFWHYDQINLKFSLNTLVRQPHSFDRINKLKFKPNDNVLFTCGEDGCFKSWQLLSSSSSISSNMNWIYSTCNGYRDMIPIDLDLIDLDNNNNNNCLLAVSFNHISTLWVFNEQDGVVFINDLIHSNLNDHVKQLKFLSKNNLLVLHNDYLNLWSINNNNNNNTSMKCINSIQINNNILVLNMILNPIDSSQAILFTTTTTTAKNNDKKDEDALKQIEIKLFDPNNNENMLEKVYSFNVYSNSKLHFICLKQQQQQTSDDDDDDENNLFNKINIYYCDNKGVLERVEYQNNNNNTDLNESMWINRKQMNKIIPKSNLTTIIDLHKSQQLKNENLIENEKNVNFEANLNKIENTPAYLLPKIGTFCYDLLKSMLNNYAKSSKEIEEEQEKKEINGNETNSEDEDDDEMNGLELNGKTDLITSNNFTPSTMRTITIKNHT